MHQGLNYIAQFFQCYQGNLHPEATPTEEHSGDRHMRVGWARLVRIERWAEHNSCGCDDDKGRDNSRLLLGSRRQVDERENEEQWRRVRCHDDDLVLS